MNLYEAFEKLDKLNEVRERKLTPIAHACSNEEISRWDSYQTPDNLISTYNVLHAQTSITGGPISLHYLKVWKTPDSKYIGKFILCEEDDGDWTPTNRELELLNSKLECKYLKSESEVILEFKKAMAEVFNAREGSDYNIRKDNIIYTRRPKIKITGSGENDYEWPYYNKSSTLRDESGNRIDKKVESFNAELKEDLINDDTPYTMSDIDLGLGKIVTKGSITSLVEIRDTYNQPVLYDAISSCFMRVYINLRHRNDVNDLGWTLYEYGIIWRFEYNNKVFLFKSTLPNSFDAYVQLNNKIQYIKVIHSDHTHCTNARDVGQVLDAC